VEVNSFDHKMYGDGIVQRLEHEIRRAWHFVDIATTETWFAGLSA